MNPARLLVFAGLTVALALSLSSSALVDACGIASRKGIRVAIADESAIIIWDEAARTQHFIRRASFQTAGEDFGFLVPTPTQPELAEASDASFKELEQLFSKFGRVAPAGKKGGGKGGGNKEAPPEVEVLDMKRVANQDIVVLKANDVDALAKWLTDHAYEFSDDLKDWAKPYIEAKWIITASKIAKDREGKATQNIGSTAVRMTFKTDKPFYPYREPADQRDKKDAQAKRLLRVFFIGQSAMQGTIGVKGEKWPAQAFPVSLGAVSRDSLLSMLKLPHSTGSQTWQMTVFEDRSSPRPGTDDVYFSPVAASDAPKLEVPKKGAPANLERLEAINAEAMMQELLRGSK